ncbi:MAG: hypothetical protein LBR24_04160, partial [Methanobrevibacter sp.]|nr:hypothetical protein [Methanobrevibacter sp.]
MEFCKNCGMLKKRCRCGEVKFKKTTSTYGIKPKKKKTKFIRTKKEETKRGNKNMKTIKKIEEKQTYDK